MHLALLFEKLDGASTISRLFLIRYVQTYPVTNVVISSVRGFVDALGIYDKGVRSALGFLIAEGYLHRTKFVGGGRGRPRQVFGIGKRLRDILQRSLKEGKILPHAACINNLLTMRLTWECAKGKRESIGLKNSEILLLAVLYSRANSFGDVEGMGFAELAGLTGLNKTQLAGHIKALTRQGYVVSYSPGSVGRGKTKSKKGIFRLAVDDGEYLPAVMIRTCESPLIHQVKLAILLAYALKVTNRVAPRIKPKEEIDFWLSVYPLRREYFESVVNCIELLWEMHEIRGRVLNQMLTDISELVAGLVLENLSEIFMEDIYDWVEGHRCFARYASKTIKASKEDRIHFFSQMVLALYKEIKMSIGCDSEDPIPIMDQFSIVLGKDHTCFDVRYRLAPKAADNHDE